MVLWEQEPLGANSARGYGATHLAENKAQTFHPYLRASEANIVGKALSYLHQQARNKLARLILLTQRHACLPFYWHFQRHRAHSW